MTERLQQQQHKEAHQLEIHHSRGSREGEMHFPSGSSACKWMDVMRAIHQLEEHKTLITNSIHSAER
jgi:hypothetical protein